MSSVSLIPDNLLAAAHLVSRIAILFLAAVPPKLMAKDKKDSSSPERAMDERGRNKGSENGAAEKEYQMGTPRFMSFVWK